MKRPLKINDKNRDAIVNAIDEEVKASKEGWQ